MIPYGHGIHANDNSKHGVAIKAMADALPFMVGES